MKEESQAIWERLWAIHEELDALVSERYRATGIFDPDHIPGTYAEEILWHKMTAPEFTELLEEIVSSDPGIREGSSTIWKHALRDSKNAANRLEVHEVGAVHL